MCQRKRAIDKASYSPELPGTQPTEANEPAPYRRCSTAMLKTSDELPALTRENGANMSANEEEDDAAFTRAGEPELPGYLPKRSTQGIQARHCRPFPINTVTVFHHHHHGVGCKEL